MRGGGFGYRLVGVEVDVDVGVGVGMENPTPVQNFTYLEPDYHFIFVCPISYFLSESVWSAKQIGGCGEVSVDVVRWVWVWL